MKGTLTKKSKKSEVFLFQNVLMKQMLKLTRIILATTKLSEIIRLVLSKQQETKNAYAQP